MRRILIGLALALIALPAWAQTQQQQHEWCYGSTATDDQTIAGCNALIKSGGLTTNNLAAAYHNRGLAYNNKGLYDQGISDNTKAIALRPDSAEAYNGRGIAYKHKGLYDQAIADYTRAIALDPNDPDAYYNRARVYEIKGQRDQAISDYRTSLRFNPGDDDTINALKRLGVAP